jgi:uncharacterized DUF497 family protein
MFSWDSRKAAVNFAKHGVSFEESATTFGDEMGLDWEDIDHSHSEDRRKRLAMSESERILLTVYTVRKLKNGKETIRIISSRLASKKERQAYFG